MSIPNVSKDTELRHLPIQIQSQLVKLLDVDDSVLSLLMGNIVKNLEDNDSELRFNSKHIDAIREHSQRHNKSAILVLLDEWSTMGRLRPKIGHFLDLLIKCQLFQAADFMADLLNERRPERPSNGPASSVDISLPNENIDEIVNDLNYPFSSIDLTTKANRINNFVKPDIHTPNMNDYMNNVFENGTAAGQSKIFNQLEMSDLMKFSKPMTTQLVPTTINTLDSQNVSAAIPLTVNSAEQQSSNFPALSGLMSTNSTSQSVSTEEQLPVFLLQSMESKSNNVTPDLSGLMNQSTTFESSSDQSQSSITESSINTTMS
ncbi:protein Tube [Chironomus tepperi]|uniref:protein Tube n=1 Tax=Chironomus tepperi TaxID=113505 RepID=UPI00391F8E7E